MSENPTGKLYFHKELFYVIRVEAWFPGWLSGRDADGQKWAGRDREFSPLSEEHARRFAPLFQTGKVIQGPWGQNVQFG